MLKMFGEHFPDHAWRVCRSIGPGERAEWPDSLPLVQPRGPGAPIHVLLGLVCARMASSHGPRIFARSGIRPRSRRLRDLPGRLPRGLFRPEAISRGASAKAARALGSEANQPEDTVGRRSHCAGGRRRRRMRSGEHPIVMPDLPPPPNFGTPASTRWRGKR